MATIDIREFDDATEIVNGPVCCPRFFGQKSSFKCVIDILKGSPPMFGVDLCKFASSCFHNHKICGEH
jgi:hypothetical protein